MSLERRSAVRSEGTQLHAPVFNGFASAQQFDHGIPHLTPTCRVQDQIGGNVSLEGEKACNALYAK